MFLLSYEAKQGRRDEPGNSVPMDGTDCALDARAGEMAGQRLGVIQFGRDLVGTQHVNQSSRKTGGVWASG